MDPASLSLLPGGKQRARVGLVRQGRPRCAPCQMEDGILENKTRGLDTIGFIEASAVGYAAPTPQMPGILHYGTLLLWRLGVEKVVHHRDNDGHALHQRDVC